MNFVITITPEGDPRWVYEVLAVTSEAALREALQRYLKNRGELIVTVNEGDTEDIQPINLLDTPELLDEGQPITVDVAIRLPRWHPQLPDSVTVLNQVSVEVKPKFPFLYGR